MPDADKSFETVFTGGSADFDPAFCHLEKKFEADFGSATVVESAEQYTGSYEVTPKTEETILQTQNKLMTDNLTVKEIPFYRVSNPAGGETVYIGREVI